MYRHTFKIALSLLLAAIAADIKAQDTSQQFDKDVLSEYSAFQKSVLNDFFAFRKSVLDDYADFLDSIWKEYQAFSGVQRDTTPKPDVAPDADTTPAAPPDSKPVAEIPKPDKPATPKPQPDKPATPKPQPDKPSTPQPQPVPTTPVAPTTPPAAMPTASFYFYGLQIKGPQLQCMQMSELSPKSASQAWKHYDQSGVKQAAQKIKDIARTLGLNDWLTYELTRECVNRQCSSSGEAACASLQHYLLANMGFDARLALCGSTPCLLLAIDQQIYARSFLDIDRIQYYVFFADGSAARGSNSISTCFIPSDVDLGSGIDMHMDNISGISSGRSHHCELSYRSMSVEADVDVVLMEMLRHYPQTDIAEYAKSDVCHNLRQDILRQLRPYVNGLPKAEAAELLLQFVQHAFDYAKDGDQHGYEKPYFFEENFYYPKNDCEDRAIFYAYLVRHLLGLDVHLVQFPGHECTAVNFGEASVTGTYYTYGGRKYVICDPTYIGASIGECMPDYLNATPKIETW